MARGRKLPAGVSPRLWAVSLFRKTLSRANFVERGGGVLQILCEPHAELVYALGGLSGRDVDKAATCADAGFAWVAAGDGQPMLLPGCAGFVRLTQLGELQDAGEHDLALCRAEFFADPDVASLSAKATTHLSSAALREAGIITDRGRAVDPGDHS